MGLQHGPRKKISDAMKQKRIENHIKCFNRNHLAPNRGSMMLSSGDLSRFLCVRRS